MRPAIDRIALNTVRRIIEGPGEGYAGWVVGVFETQFGAVYVTLDAGAEVGEVTTRAVNTEPVDV